MKGGFASKPRVINVSEFKAKALQFISLATAKGLEFIITKNGTPVVRVIPIKLPSQKPITGSLKNKIKINGDIVNFDTSEDWDVLKK